MQQLDGDSILANASNLYDQWPLLDDVAKRNVIEQITNLIEISNEEITIKFSYVPTLPFNPPTSQHNVTGSLIP